MSIQQVPSEHFQTAVLHRFATYANLSGFSFQKYSASLAKFQVALLESTDVSQRKSQQRYCTKGKITYFTLSSFQK